jgi:virginiamycin B lyase
MWFTGNSKIGMITPSGTVTYYTLPSGAEPIHITSGPDGALWFTDENNNAIGRITTSGSVAEYPVTSGSDPYGITAGPDNAIWFTEITGSGHVGRIGY